jgi:Carboxypeptidase regulatory-like domain/TonB dependent receptor
MLMMKRLFVCVLMCCLGASLSGQSQITTGVIQGTVTDATGAQVPGAQVEVRNADTNFTRTLSTKDDGRFVFLQLPPGPYVITVTKQGFTTVVQEDVRLTVGQSITFDAVLKVSGTSETVTVSAASGLDVSKTEISNTLNETTVSTTPILGRKFEDLLTLTPGVSIVQGPDGDEITFAGQRGIFNNISLDGGDYNNGFFGEQLGGQRAAIDITLEAVREFQVVASGANAEFGRTAGGVINVITKSGTNDPHGSLFHFQRLENLASKTSDGKPLTDFHREQFGGTFGGPIRKDRVFFFGALEHINENLTRANLSEPLGPACPVAAPVITNPAHEALINDSAECQRVALLNFFRTTRNQEEGLPIDHKINNTGILTKIDWLPSTAHTFTASYNFDYSKNENQTFDVATYGNSANGTEGPSKINVLNVNFLSTLAATKLNEFHFTYSRELRPRSATPSNVPPDTAMGFATTFRFGNPFFLGPNVDEMIWRTQLKDNFSLIWNKHTIKTGGEWIHTLNDQIFRGFFQGRYIFDSVAGFLRYASPAAVGGFGPNTVGCSNGTFVTLPASCPAGTTTTGGPLFLYLQGAGLSGPATDAAGASNITNDEFALFIQDQWQALPNLTITYGLRWDAQLMADIAVNPGDTAYGRFLNDPRFPSDGTIPDQTKQFQPRVGAAWDVKNDRKSVLRGSAGIYYARQNMLSQVGSVTTNGLQQQTIFASTDNIRMFGAAAPVWPGVVTPPVLRPGEFPLFSGVRVFDRDYKNPRITTANIAFEQQLAPDWSAYVDFTWSKGRDLTRFLNYNRADRGAPFGPFLDEVMVATSKARAQYKGGTFGLRKRFSKGFQLEGNYVLSKDMDSDSKERDPFVDYSFYPSFADLDKDYGPADRDIRHKFNLYGYGDLPWGLKGNARIQARSAQPITPDPRVVNGVDLGRNSARKDNEYSSFDWRVMRPFRFGKGYEVVPIFEMFNTFNSANNVNPLVAPALFDFNGFLRLGVGDPRQAQLAVRVTF